MTTKLRFPRNEKSQRQFNTKRAAKLLYRLLCPDCGISRPGKRLNATDENKKAAMTTTSASLGINERCRTAVVYKVHNLRTIFAEDEGRNRLWILCGARTGVRVCFPAI